jgi:hypothetical protein
MSQDFKFNFKGGEEKSQSTENDNNLYSQPGNVRNLCFEWPDGRKKFLNYAYLISGEYSPLENVIVLTFTTEQISLQGVNLAKLFNEILRHQTAHIRCEEQRYIQINTNDYFVTAIV